jgi:hypothetical protein
MNPTAEIIRIAVNAARPKLEAIAPETACLKPASNVWSKQEILGHLIDSAYNNHQRLVRGAYNAAMEFPPYKQESWVDLQAYNERGWHELIDLWVAANLHLCAMIDRLTDEQLENPCNISRPEPVTLRFVVEDYPRHMNMHLADILK